MRRSVALLFLLLLLLCVPLVGGGGSPAQAAVHDPLHLVHGEQVSGDFLMAGNGVLVCPGAEGIPRTECLAASRRENAFNNNRFAMSYADVDADPATYDSSSAAVTLPAGARVTYARLQWGGNRDGQQCAVGAGAPIYPAGSSRTQAVRLSVGDGAATDVAPADYTTDTTSVGYYSADAEVTDAFEGARSGSAITVTVGNVFAPTGAGCHGGWSLIVVHTDDSAGCEADRRQVFVFDGHVRQGVTDAPLDVTASGFSVDGGPARVGVTAYEGDNGQDGDRLLLDGTPLADPATGSTSNFFSSTADGQRAPTYANNFSVDSKKLDVPAGVVAPGDTSATLRITTTADAFMLQSLVLSVPVPSLCLTKTVVPSVAHPGDVLTWTVGVRNPTTTDATGVTVGDDAVPGCTRALGVLPAGGETAYTCTSVATDDLDNVATVSGTGAGGTVLSAAASASVDVISPAIAVTKTGSRTRGTPGAEVARTVLVRNTGNTVLRQVRLEDPVAPGCARADVGPLDAGAERTVTCRSTLVRDDLTNTVTATGVDVLGLAVTDRASATVTVLTPEVELAVMAPDTADAGASVPISIEVTDSGETGLRDVVVRTPGLPSCARDGLRLAAGRTLTVRCRVLVDEPIDSTVTVSAQPAVAGDDTGRRVRATATLVVNLSSAAPTGPASGADPAGASVGPTATPATPATPGSVLPDTGSPGALVPVLVAGLLALGAGAVLLRRSGYRGSGR